MEGMREGRHVVGGRHREGGEKRSDSGAWGWHSEADLLLSIVVAVSSDVHALRGTVRERSAEQSREAHESGAEQLNRIHHKN